MKNLEILLAEDLVGYRELFPRNVPGGTCIPYLEEDSRVVAAYFQVRNELRHLKYEFSILT